MIAVFCALGGVAGAALVGDGNVGKACVSKDGTLKVVDSTTTACPGTQTMVSFAGVDGNGAVANADKLDGKDSTDFLDKSGQATSAATAANADKLDGKDSSEFLGKTEKAASAASADNADTLDRHGLIRLRTVRWRRHRRVRTRAGRIEVHRPAPRAGLLPHHHPRLSQQRLQGRLCRHRHTNAYVHTSGPLLIVGGSGGN